MKKRRKRTSKDVPAKGRLADLADRLWSLAVKDDWAHRCAICGRRENLNSHHLIPRQHQATRFDLRNGICLCKTCHQFCPNYSPHQHGKGFDLWLTNHHPSFASWVEANAYPKFTGTTNADYYCEQIQRLREYVEQDDFTRIVGVRFAAYLEAGGNDG